MKPRKDKIEQLLSQYLPSASKEDMEADGARVLQRLKSNREMQARDWATELRSSVPRTRRFVLKWGVAVSFAALAIAAVWVGSNLRHHSAQGIVTTTAEGSLLRRVQGKAVPVRAGEKIEADEILRANDDANAMLTLADGSRVEVRWPAELSFESAPDGVRIMLRQGGILVNAAKQRDRHLYVETKDFLVSVVGTVFLVNTDQVGSRVAVFEGVVRVMRGNTETLIRPGEQLATNPMVALLPVTPEISWTSKEAPRGALTQVSTQAPTTTTPKTPQAPTFEVATIKRTPPEATENGSMTLFPPGRFRKTNGTLRDLIGLAYKLQDFQISGGPKWAEVERFDVEAKAEGEPGRDEKLAMIQVLLADRFHLKIQRRTEEAAVYALLQSKDGIKVERVPDSESPNATFNRYTGKRSMDRFAEYLSGIVGQPVVDRTGLPGFYDIKLEFTPEWVRERFPGRAGTVVFNGANIDLNGPSIFTALEEQLGLRLERSRGSVEFVVIESATLPTED